MRTPRHWWFVLLGLWLVLVVAITATPTPSTNTSEWSCVFCSERALADALLNVLLFVPLGVLLGLSKARPTSVVLAIFLTTGLVEFGQLFIPGRDASIGDVIANAAGGGLGIMFSRQWRTLARPSPEMGRWLSIAWSGVVSATLVSSSILLQPSFTTSSYFGQWTPNLGHLEWYRGQVLRARVGDMDVPPWRSDSSDVLRRSLEVGSPASVAFVAGQRTARLSSVFSIADEAQRGIILIGVDGPDLVVRYRLRASDWRLDAPDLRMQGSLEHIDRGDTVVVEFWRNGATNCVRRDDQTDCSLGFNLGLGWSLFMYPEQLMPNLAWLFEAAWLFLLFLPAGYWGGLTRNVAWIAVPGGTAVSLPYLFEINGVSISGWIGISCGALFGILARWHFDKRSFER